MVQFNKVAWQHIINVYVEEHLSFREARVLLTSLRENYKHSRENYAHTRKLMKYKVNKLLLLGMRALEFTTRH